MTYPKPMRWLIGLLFVVIALLSVMIVMELVRQSGEAAGGGGAVIDAGAWVDGREAGTDWMTGAGAVASDALGAEPAGLPEPSGGQMLTRQASETMDRVSETSVWLVSGSAGEELASFYDTHARRLGFTPIEATIRRATGVTVKQYERSGETLMVRLRREATGTRVLIRFGYTKAQAHLDPLSSETDPS
ncbi:MAG: hypothetical protein MI802_20795 [Desulfobacterales bacterium]|nr:hypothetical protein [Desulfobacterales bacterium]